MAKMEIENIFAGLLLRAQGDKPVTKSIAVLDIFASSVVA